MHSVFPTARSDNLITVGCSSSAKTLLPVVFTLFLIPTADVQFIGPLHLDIKHSSKNLSPVYEVSHHHIQLVKML